MDKFQNISTFAIFSYFFLDAYLIYLASFKFMNTNWFYEISWWNTNGLLKVFPIFSLSFTCQTAIIMIYNEMNENIQTNYSLLVDRGILISLSAYLLAGFFGYIAFSHVKIYGNVVTNMSETFVSLLIQFGVMICVCAAYPTLLIPCRNSVNTLIGSLSSNLKRSSSDDLSPIISDENANMPENRFRYITLFLVLVSAFISIFLPNLEFILSLSGSTTGSLITFVWPSIFILYGGFKLERHQNIMTKLFLILGVMVCVICTTETILRYQPTRQTSDVDIVHEAKIVEAINQESLETTLKEITTFLATKPNLALIQAVDVVKVTTEYKEFEARKEPPVPFDEENTKFVEKILQVKKVVKRSVSSNQTELGHIKEIQTTTTTTSKASTTTTTTI
jgi:sodium-coupled neutral amino acid transporter 10